MSDKIQLIENLLEKCDELIIGGGMAFTFKKVINNVKIGQSLFDEEGAAIVSTIMAKAAAKNVAIHLPSDYVCGDKFAADAAVSHADDNTGIPDTCMGLDIGEKVRQAFQQCRGTRKNSRLEWANGRL